MSRFLFLLILFLIVGCNKHSKESSTEAKEIQAILKKAEDLVNAQTSLDSLLPLTLDYSSKAKQYNDPVHVYRSEFKIGAFLAKKNLYEEAIEQYEKTLAVITVDKDSARYVQTKMNIALTYVHLKNYGKAAEIFYEANKIAERNNLQRFIFTIKVNMGYLNLEENKLARSVKIFKDGIRYILENDLIVKKPYTYQKHFVVLHTLIAKAYNKAAIVDSAFIYVEKGLEANKNNGRFKDCKANLLIQKGKAYQKQKDFSKALENYEAAKKIFVLDQNETQVSTVLLHIAECHYENKRYTKTLSVLEDIELRKLSNYMPDDLFYDVLKLTRNTYRELGDYKKATRYTALSEDLKDSIELKKGRDQKLYLTTKYNYEKAESDVEKQKQAKKKQLYWMLGILFAIISVFVFITYKYRKVTKEKTISKKSSPQPLKDDKTVNDILKKLQKLEEDEFFLNPKYNLYATAKKIGTNTTYLSTILNVHQKKTFTEYLNELRITYTIHRLQTDEQFRQYTVKAIAEEVGYKSHSPFSRAFKAKTGMNPSEYIKKLP
ncbi:helix-turn-helix domain-containing protein [uncultured Kordia sp.]|uniref:helix-turn-helix domain-containing protein n=1 Tax=uncultured Kordia sp. TaxID=507699 RepID=UPI00262DEF3E|nr:helix-turn-helix domain-containing protein [uncultured Kordia sp.]